MNTQTMRYVSVTIRGMLYECSLSMITVFHILLQDAELIRLQAISYGPTKLHESLTRSKALTRRQMSITGNGWDISVAAANCR